jgi:hypothetical protein
MIMKKILLFVSILAFSANISAQDFSWGPKLSVSSPSLKLKDVKNLESASQAVNLLEEKDAKLGYQIGVFARVSLLGIYVQPEVLFSNSSTEIKFTDVMDEENNPVDVIGEVSMNKIDIPVMFGKRFLRVFRVNAGPVFTLLLSENIKQEGLSDTFKEVKANYKNSTIGLQLGAGLDLSIVTIDLRYELGLQSISDNITIGETEFATDQRLNQFLLSVGIKF